MSIKDSWLFREKRTDGGGWVSGHLNIAAGMPFITAFGERNPAQINPDTIGRCTGLRDNNDVLIFEGDVVKQLFGVGYDSKIHPSHISGTAEGKVIAGSHYEDQENCECGWNAFDSPFDSNFYYEYEVVGNIHDGYAAGA